MENAAKDYSRAPNDEFIYDSAVVINVTRDEISSLEAQIKANEQKLAEEQSLAEHRANLQLSDFIPITPNPEPREVAEQDQMGAQLSEIAHLSEISCLTDSYVATIEAENKWHQVRVKLAKMVLDQSWANVHQYIENVDEINGLKAKQAQNDDRDDNKTPC